MKKCLTCVFCLLGLLALLSGCAKAPESQEQGQMSVQIKDGKTVRTGTALDTYQLEPGQAGSITLRLDREAGSFSLDIYPTDQKDAPVYTGRELDSTSFQVFLSQLGEYRVLVTLKQFVGDYTLTWSTQEEAP